MNFHTRPLLTRSSFRTNQRSLYQRKSSDLGHCIYLDMAPYLGYIFLKSTTPKYRARMSFIDRTTDQVADELSRGTDHDLRSEH